MNIMNIKNYMNIIKTINIMKMMNIMNIMNIINTINITAWMAMAGAVPALVVFNDITCRDSKCLYLCYQVGTDISLRLKPSFRLNVVHTGWPKKTPLVPLLVVLKYKFKQWYKLIFFHTLGISTFSCCKENISVWHFLWKKI